MILGQHDIKGNEELYEGSWLWRASKCMYMMTWYALPHIRQSLLPIVPSPTGGYPIFFLQQGGRRGRSAEPSFREIQKQRSGMCTVRFRLIKFYLSKWSAIKKCMPK